MSPLYVSYSRQSSTWAGEPPEPTKAHTRYPRRAQGLPLKAQAREAQSQDGSSARYFLECPGFLCGCVCINFHAPPPPPLSAVSSKGTACVLTCKAKSKTLCLALPPNFLACPSLNIDFAPPLSSLIRDGNRTANNGIE